MPQYDAVIVGGGVAGLTAARDLKDRGVSSLIVEARDRVGGRTHSRPLAGHPEFTIDIGGTYIHLSHQLDLAEEVRRYSLPVLAEEGELNQSCFVVRGERRLGLPIPVEEIGHAERAVTRMVEAARRVSAAVPWEEQGIADLDVGFDEFFAPLELPPATREFLCGFIGQPLQADPARFSMLNALSWIDTFGSFTDAFFGIAGERLQDGMSALTGALLEDAGADLVLGSRVTAIVREGDRVEVKTASGETYTAGACIVAMPSHLLDEVEFAPGLGEEKARVLAPEVEYITPGFKTFLVVEDAIPGLFGLAGIGGEYEPRIGWLFEDRELGDGQRLLVAWGRGEGFGGDLAAAQEALSVYMPGVKVLAMDGHDWAADPLTGGLVRIGTPGQARFASVMSRPEGAVAFAGSDTAQGRWMSWVEGAVASGHRAARQTVAWLAD